MTIISLSQTTKPKSDQLNAEDFLSSSKTLTITGICFSGSEDQPLLIYTDFDSKKPYKPNKSMRKILESVWGDVSSEVGRVHNIWNGRQLNLYRDADVEWAGKKEGGIVINAMSNLDREIKISLQKKRGQKKEYLIKPILIMPMDQQKKSNPALKILATSLRDASKNGSLALQKEIEIVPEKFKTELAEWIKTCETSAAIVDAINDKREAEMVGFIPPTSEQKEPQALVQIAEDNRDVSEIMDL